MSKKKVLVAGGGGFIGGHLAARLLKDGHQVRCVDVKPIDEWYLVFRVGVWKDDSYFIINGDDDAQLMIRTGVSLVRPTAKEIAQFGKAEKVGAA